MNEVVCWGIIGGNSNYKWDIGYIVIVFERFRNIRCRNGRVNINVSRILLSKEVNLLAFSKLAPIATLMIRSGTVVATNKY